MGRVVDKERAAPLVGPVGRGCEIFGLTMGKCSIIEVLAHVLEHIEEPVELAIGCWTVAAVDLRWVKEQQEAGKLTGVTWVIDFSFAFRDECKVRGELTDAFGHANVFTTAIHAKFFLLRGAGWNLVIRSSANPNYNTRIESFELSDHAELSAVYWEFVDLVKASGLNLAEALRDWTVAEDTFWALGGKPNMLKAQLAHGVGHKGMAYGTG